jgi:hypothetical protein
MDEAREAGISAGDEGSKEEFVETRIVGSRRMRKSASSWRKGSPPPAQRPGTALKRKE